MIENKTSPATESEVDFSDEQESGMRFGKTKFGLVQGHPNSAKVVGCRLRSLSAKVIICQKLKQGKYDVV